MGVLSACGPADPALVQSAVSATLAAIPTQTPVVVVVTVPVPVTVAAANPVPAIAVTDTAMPATPTPATSMPTDAPTSTPTLPVRVTPSHDLLFSDDFSQNQVWDVTDLTDQATSVQEGVLRFTIKRADRFGILFNTSRRASNFEAVVRTRPATPCATRDRYGLLFRVQDASNYYQFEVDCEGRYRLALVRNGFLTPLQDWTSHPAIVAAGDNDLYVQAIGDAIQLGVNTVALSAHTDPTLAEGGFGFYAGSGTRTGLTVLFDDLQVYEVK